MLNVHLAVAYLEAVAMHWLRTGHMIFGWRVGSRHLFLRFLKIISYITTHLHDPFPWLTQDFDEYHLRIFGNQSRLPKPTTSSAKEPQFPCSETASGGFIMAVPGFGRPVVTGGVIFWKSMAEANSRGEKSQRADGEDDLDWP